MFKLISKVVRWKHLAQEYWLGRNSLELGGFVQGLLFWTSVLGWRQRTMYIISEANIMQSPSKVLSATNWNIIGSAFVQVLAVEIACCSFRADIPSASQSTTQKHIQSRKITLEKRKQHKTTGLVLDWLCLENYERSIYMITRVCMNSSTVLLSANAQLLNQRSFEHCRTCWLTKAYNGMPRSLVLWHQKGQRVQKWRQQKKPFAFHHLLSTIYANLQVHPQIAKLV